MIQSIIPGLSRNMPELFERDKYNRFDGVVPANMRPIAAGDIRNDEGISNLDKAQMLNKLNKTGVLDEY